jgi:hypothetical protein
MYSPSSVRYHGVLSTPPAMLYMMCHFLVINSIIGHHGNLQFSPISRFYGVAHPLFWLVLRKVGMERDNNNRYHPTRCSLCVFFRISARSTLALPNS